MDILERIRQRASSRQQHIVLPEGNDTRTVVAAAQCTSQRIARITLLGDENTIRNAAGDNGVDAYSEAFNRVNLNGGPLSAGPLSTVTLIATAVGIVDVAWETTPPVDLEFFGLETAPGTSFTIVPEPGTGALLGLGLVALSAPRRRVERSSR